MTVAAPQIRGMVGASQPGLARSDHDLHRTAAWVTRALLAVERFPGIVWEPACGLGDIAEVLEADVDVDHVFASDLVDRGYGKGNVEFLTTAIRGPDHVVTNPPLKYALAFAKRARELVPGKVALVGRVAWLAGVGRYHSLWSLDPPARVHVFTTRPEFARGTDGEFISGLIDFAWYVWDGDVAVGETRVDWFPPCREATFQYARRRAA